jgi:hypothetical protein
MIELPKKYTEFLWEKGGKVEEHRQYIGKNCVSWSQIESFNDKTGFNTGLLGKYEYFIKYFSGQSFPDMGWAQFGQEVENYITEKLDADKFSNKEKETLNKIKPLGVFQQEILIYFEDLDTVVLGYLDDSTPPKEKTVNLLRDYKTKSESSKKDLHDDKKHQLEIYILGLRQKGLEVTNAEYCIIERLGGRECMQGGGREVLKVGEKIWYEPYSWDEKRLQQTEKMVKDTIKEISEYWKIYQKYFT